MKTPLQVANYFVIKTVWLPGVSPEYNRYRFTEAVQLTANHSMLIQQTNYTNNNCLQNSSTCVTKHIP